MPAATRRVVFVDDDPLVLRSIKRLMTRSLASWDLVFAESGGEALEAMRIAPVDIVVSDLNMGQMDGAMLLRQVQNDAPEVVRIILSGSTSREEACLTTKVAHQFLAKPFDGTMLGRTLRRAVDLREILEDPRLRRLVAGRNELPAVPTLYLQLTAALKREDASLVEVARILEQDPGTVARILQVTSSAFVGRRQPPRTIREAVVSVGLTVVKSLVLTHQIVSAFQSHLPGFSIEEVQKHGLKTAALASEILADVSPDEAFLAGMMHVVGRIILASRSPRHYAAVLEAAAAEATPICKVELDMLGASHGEVGAHLLGLWGLPQTVVEAVAFCHQPSKIGDTELSTASAVYLATRLAHDPSTPVAAGGDYASTIDADLVARLGIEDRLERWRHAAQDVPQSDQT